MTGGTPPFEIDLVEVLYGTGEVPARLACQMAGDDAAAWRIIARMVAEKTAAVWVLEQDGSRRLEDWEVLRVLRSRTQASGEPTPADDDLVVRAAERTSEAYHTDYSRWYDRHLGTAE